MGRVDLHRGAPRPFREAKGHRLVLDEGQQGLVRRMPETLPCFPLAADLVDLVDEDEAVAAWATILSRAASEPSCPAPARGGDGARAPSAPLARFLPEDVGVNGHGGRADGEGGVRGEELLDARMSVVFPEPDEPTRRTLPTRRLASFFARATEISRTASCWPKTRFERAAAILAGGGTELTGAPASF